jgi:hypothetical protein
MKQVVSTKYGAGVNEYVEVERRYGHLAEGVSCRGELCPKCGGGRNREKTFGVSRLSGRLVFNCYRASCGFKGSTTSSGRPVVPSEGARQPERIDGRSRYQALGKGPVPEDVRKYLDGKYGLVKHLLAKGQFHWTEEHSPPGHGRLVMPLLNTGGEAYGYVARKLDTQYGPKALTMCGANEGSWYPCEGSDELIIVEDQLSALRASEFMNAVALLGVNVTDAMIKEIKKTGYSAVFLALDADAFPTAIKLAHKLRNFFKVKVIKLDCDIKDMTDQAIADVMFEAGAEFYRGD